MPEKGFIRGVYWHKERPFYPRFRLPGGFDRAIDVCNLLAVMCLSRRIPIREDLQEKSFSPLRFIGDRAQHLRQR